MKSGLSRLTNLQQRVITAVVGAATIVTAIAAGPWSYFVLFLLIGCFAQLEFYRLVGLDGNAPLRTYGTLSTAIIFTLSFLVERGVLADTFYFLIFPLVSGIFLIKLYRKGARKPFTDIAFTFLGIIYVGFPFALFNFAVFRATDYYYQVALGAVLLLWASDTGAYFAGTYFGKTQLFARVSPKKSWEGSIGGAVLSLLMATGLMQFFDQLTPFQWYGVAVIIIVAGTYGDLVESLFKRSIDIKDSGTSIPGHGGFLDRFDGLLLAAPFITAFLKLVA